jgi:hypothetical protein
MCAASSITASQQVHLDEAEKDVLAAGPLPPVQDRRRLGQWSGRSSPTTPPPCRAILQIRAAAAPELTTTARVST